MLQLDAPGGPKDAGIRVAGNGSDHVIRVLLVEDNFIIRLTLSRFLRTESGIEVVAEAGSGLEGVEMACRLLPDVVLMDVSMPDIDGIEATRRIVAACPQVRVIGLTLHTDVSDEMCAAGAVACLDKGMLPESLASAIRELAAAGDR